MATLLGILVLIAPLAGITALMLVTGRRQALRHHEIGRQIALTDALHARLGAAVAPVVEWRHRTWRVALAVPFERPAVVAAVLVTIDECFGRARYEIVLSRQAPAVLTSDTPRRTALGQESLSWT
jgi:hypothetical protein